MKNIAIYIHWPYCAHKCPYCDFNSHVTNIIDHYKWSDAYEKEIYKYREYIENKNISSIFFGGGTPSLMVPNLVETILNTLSKFAHINKNCEITLEANPTSSEANKFKNFKNAGINRLSIGVQSLKNESLKFLGRTHDANEAKKVIEIASNIFDNFSFDLIYGLPDQTINDWVLELTEALKFGSRHISLYQLTIEKGTKFFSDYKLGKFQLPSEELAANLYDTTTEILNKNDFKAYEISNYAKFGHESKHNLTYWKYEDYLGIGPGAHSRLNTFTDNPLEIVMIYNPDKWLNNAHNDENTTMKYEKLDKSQKIMELILMNMRLDQGIDKNFITYFPKNIQNNIFKLIDENMLEELNNFVKIPSKKKIIANKIIEKILL